MKAVNLDIYSPFKGIKSACILIGDIGEKRHKNCFEFLRKTFLNQGIIIMAVFSDINGNNEYRGVDGEYNHVDYLQSLS